MPETTPILALPLIAAGQAQKHVTHNEALIQLDAVVQLACRDKDLAAPPAAPAEGDRYLVLSPAPTGAWAGLSGQVAQFQDGRWRGLAPKPGWLAWILDEDELYIFTAAGWVRFRSTLRQLQTLTRLGLGTTADAANPFAAKLNTALWTALTAAEGGTGDLRCTLNKQGPGNVLSLLFQSAFTGRAEIGLSGSDDLTIKVAPDTGGFREALRIDRATGRVDVAGPAPAPLLGAPALRLTQDLATDGSLLAGGLTMQASSGGLAWTVAGLAGTGGTGGTAGGFPGGLAVFVKPADGARSGALREAARFGPEGNLGLGTSAPLTTRLGVAGIIAHAADNTWSLGTPALRASVLYAGTGAISTSDAREKTPVAPLSEAEIAAGRALAREIGTFRFHDAVARKGDGARRHVGLTVQRAVAILEAEGLDPFAYGFVCRDSWPAVAPQEAVPATEAVRDADGATIAPAVPAQAACPGRAAGERYGFRTDQLLLFLARGFEARLTALEAAAGP
ncbi:DUF2793 domain-containing protein [Methylobacterium sp. Leaf89]|uniref:DUF2793 domain-containing protein n=1 Tax=Methylobacterium sp. Leaf89 TaxID=1736245 RepID=UPI0006F83A5A|nr:DUF2793 domain-containing protein [Methylobacterium sp. Leaf89]KQO69318.1 hypothetical protein ASF18_02500 [Methylobacterium sp. Leaf89]